MSDEDIAKAYFEGMNKPVESTEPDNSDFEDYEAIKRAEEVAQEIVAAKERKKPKKGRGGTENFPNVLPSDISKEHIGKTLNKMMMFWSMPQVEDDAELADRLYNFFILCMESQQHPTWEKLCYYIGFHESTVSRWLTGMINATETRRNLIKKAKDFCAIYDAELAMDGKINPIIYIFRAKNFFGMVDRVEHVANTDNSLGQLKDHNEIAGRILGNVGGEVIEVDFTDED